MMVLVRDPYQLSHHYSIRLLHQQQLTERLHNVEVTSIGRAIQRDHLPYPLNSDAFPCIILIVG
jgi:hypothetical protein